MTEVRGMGETRLPPRGLVSQQEEKRGGEDQEPEELKIGESLIAIVLQVI